MFNITVKRKIYKPIRYEMITRFKSSFVPNIGDTILLKECNTYYRVVGVDYVVNEYNECKEATLITTSGLVATDED